MENLILTGGNSRFGYFDERLQRDFAKIWRDLQGNQVGKSSNQEHVDLLKIFPVKNKVFSNLEGLGESANERAADHGRAGAR